MLRRCEDCRKMDKTVDIRQSDYMLCDKCQAVRQEDEQKKKDKQTKTTSGQFTVVNSPNVKAKDADAPITSPAQKCNGPCSTKDGEVTCCCFISLLFARGNFILFAQI